MDDTDYLIPYYTLRSHAKILSNVLANYDSIDKDRLSFIIKHQLNFLEYAINFCEMHCGKDGKEHGHETPVQDASGER